MLRNINSETKSIIDIPRQSISATASATTDECDSEHTICQRCENDQITDSGSNDTIHFAKSRHRNIDLAGGDHKKSSLKDVSKVGSYRTEVKYKNVNFKESHSDIDDDQDDATYNTDVKASKQEVANSQNVKLVQRPITCPITECGRIVAVDSVSLHFYFDHSKIPRIPINGGANSGMHLKVSQISTKSRCFAVFSLKPQDRQSKVEPPLLLMGAKYCTKASTVKPVETQNFSPKDALVLWICKVADTVHNYSITIARDDRRLGHSYIGEAIHMKDSQDVKSIFCRAECLIVTGKAVNKILETQEHLIIFVHILI